MSGKETVKTVHDEGTEVSSENIDDMEPVTRVTGDKQVTRTLINVCLSLSKCVGILFFILTLANFISFNK